MALLIRPTCLIFSTMNDVHVPAVIAKMSKESIPFVCDFSQFGKDFGGSLRADTVPPLILALASGTRISLENLKTIWWRRPQPFFAHPPTNPGLANYVHEENYRFWESALALLSNQDLAWYNPFDANRVADRKTLQLSRAKAVGLKVPDTLVTSLRADAEEFLSSKSEAIFKSYSGNEDFWQPTRRFKIEMLDHFDKLHICPVIFQEFIDGYWDYRVTLIDDFIQAVRFDIRNSRYKYDVRIDMRNKAEKCELETEIKHKIQEFAKSLGLKYASIDLRETLTGELVFFEVNPAGQFLYLDHLAGTDIARAMAEALSVRPENSLADTDQIKSLKSFIFNEEDQPFAAAVTERVTHLE